jgi:acetyl esterase/lipase
MPSSAPFQTPSRHCQKAKAVAEAMRGAGCPVELFLYPGCGHGFMNVLTGEGQALIESEWGGGAGGQGSEGWEGVGREGGQGQAERSHACMCARCV